MNQSEREGKPEVDLDFVLWRVLDHTRFMISRLREKELDQFGITPEMSYILDILTQRGGTTTINEIAEITMRKHHSISTQIARMAKQGLVKKIKNHKDLRGYDIVITEKGQDLFKRITRDSIREVFSCLSIEDKKALDIRLKALLMHAYHLSKKEFRIRFHS
ncbi:MAG: MarR family transcriptional regulator [Dehalococcoidales bacterium]|jgi:DNA-binding MarR family transcriptional regulator|nr:MarR family transcriptional regulator [Dehalococcoidales bacterium]